MNARTYIIAGRVVDAATRGGIQGVTVEAWDRDTRFHDMLGSTVTDAEGAFSIAFDSAYFGDYGGDIAPDIFFRLYRDQRLVLTTEATPIENAARGTHEVLLELDTGTAPEQGRDRVTTLQAIKAINFFKQSDFAGVAREQRSKASMVGQFAGRILQTGLKNVELEPIKPRGTQTSEIVGQTAATAQMNLARNQVAVTDVKAYQPGAHRHSFIALAAAPLRLRAGDAVTLYEEDGLVRYYSVNKREKAATLDADAVARLDADVSTLKSNVNELTGVRGEVAGIKATFDREQAQLASELASVRTRADEVTRLKSELSELRQATVSKDVEIAALQQQVREMRAAQADFAQRISPEKINQIEEELRRLRRPDR